MLALGHLSFGMQLHVGNPGFWYSRNIERCILGPREYLLGLVLAIALTTVLVEGRDDP